MLDSESSATAPSALRCSGGIEPVFDAVSGRWFVAHAAWSSGVGGDGAVAGPNTSGRMTLRYISRAAGIPVFLQLETLGGFTRQMVAVALVPPSWSMSLESE